MTSKNKNKKAVEKRRRVDEEDVVVKKAAKKVFEEETEEQDETEEEEVEEETEEEEVEETTEEVEEQEETEEVDDEKDEEIPEPIKPIEPVISKDRMVYLQKIGGGSLRLPGKIVKPNEKFWWPADQIPVAFKDLLKVLDESESVKTAKKAAQPLYKVLPTDVTDVFAVVNTKTKKVLADDLTQEEADKMVAQLNKK